MESSPLPANSIQETMLGPLWARAIYSQQNPEILVDPEAVRVLPRVRYDFSLMQSILGEWRSIGLLIRARAFDDALRAYLVTHPDAIVVNLGAGLDTTFSRVDNGTLRWYDLDLPEAVAFRKQFIPETPRSTCIPKSVFDLSWCEEINPVPERGIFLIAGGLLYYFHEAEVRTLVTHLAERFPGGGMVFDVVSKLAAWVVNRRARKHSDTALRFHFAVGNPSKIFNAWSPKLHLKHWTPIGVKVLVNPHWEDKTKKMLKIGRTLKTGKIVQLTFSII